MTLRVRLLFLAGFLLLFGTVVLGQPKTPLPTLTSDDVIGIKPPIPAPAASAKEAHRNPAQAEQSPVKDAAATTPVKAAEDPQKKAGKEWNERLKKAQEKRSELERSADQTELQIAQLRNQLFSAAAKAPEANSQINARMNEHFSQLQRLRAEAQTAQAEEAALQAEGRANSYQVAAVALTNEKGEPDAQAYQDEQHKLESDLRAAQARIEVLQMRLNSIQSESLKKGSGDNFTLNRLRGEREETTAELGETRAKIEELTNKLQTHRQKTAAAGIPLGA